MCYGALAGDPIRQQFSSQFLYPSSGFGYGDFSHPSGNIFGQVIQSVSITLLDTDGVVRATTERIKGGQAGDICIWRGIGSKGLFLVYIVEAKRRTFGMCLTARHCFI
jgi:hypothetical protein